MRLSPHFTDRELTATQHRDIPNEPPPWAVDRLRTLCATLLEPLRERFGVILVTSGYRSPHLNAAVGGSSTSVHPLGLAADVHAADDDVSLDDLVRFYRDSGLPFDQVIRECGRWVHVGLPRPGCEPRRELLTTDDGRSFRPWKENP